MLTTSWMQGIHFVSVPDRCSPPLSWSNQCSHAHALQVYDKATNSWASSMNGAYPPLPAGRGGMGKAVHLNGRILLMGGEVSKGGKALLGQRHT